MIDIYHHISRYLTFNNLTRLNDHYTQPVVLLATAKHTNIIRREM